MSGRTDAEMLARRDLLLARSAALRSDWSVQVQVLRKPLTWVDKTRDGLRWLSDNPAWPLGVAVAVLLLRPQRVLGLASKLWWGYGIYRRGLRLFGLAQPQPRPQPR